MSKIYIGVSGVARTGKNLFCNIAEKQLWNKYKLTSSTYALAYELKNDCKDFVRSKLDLDIFSEKTDDKDMFRPLLVWFADMQRRRTNGRYWLELVNERLNNDYNDVALISDIRFAEYTKDELYWLKNELKGKLIHISKYKIVDGLKIFVNPPNSTEEVNDPFLIENADYRIEWEDIGGINQINNEYLNREVEKCLQSILKQ